MSAFSDDKDMEAETEKAPAPLSPSLKAAEPVCSDSLTLSSSDSPKLLVSSEHLTTAQRDALSLKCCFERVVSADKASDDSGTVAYFFNKEVLISGLLQHLIQSAITFIRLLCRLYIANMFYQLPMKVNVQVIWE